MSVCLYACMSVCMHACMYIYIYIYIYVYMYWRVEKINAAVDAVCCAADAAHCCSAPFVAHAVLLSCHTVVFTVGYRADSSLTQGLVLSQDVEPIPKHVGELCWSRECIVES